MDRFLLPILFLALLLTLASQTPLMIEQKDQFLEKIKTKNMAVVFYGNIDTPQYQSFQQLIPSPDRLFEGLQFLYVPANKFKLNRNNPSLSVYRKIGGGNWQSYRGSFNKDEMDKWIQKNTKDPLKEVTIEQLQNSFRAGLKTFILLSYGQFELLRTKIYLDDFCTYKQIKCWKVEPSTPIYSTVTKLLGVGKDDFGISKLGFYNPATERIQLYTKDVWMLRKQQLLEMFEGRKGITHPQTNEEIQIQLLYSDDHDAGL